MKKYIVLFLLFLSVLCFGQNREKVILPIISKENKGVLLKAKGWLKNQYGEWVSRDNKIPNDLGIEYKAVDNFEYYSLGQDNFVSYQVKDIQIEDVTYVLLIKKEKWGYYLYPTINEGWKTSGTCKYYIFDKSELIKFQNVLPETMTTINLKLIYSGNIQPVNFLNLNDLYLSKEINREIIKQKAKQYEEEPDYLSVDITLFENKKIVQFYFWKNYEQHENRYYEVDLLTFNKFIKIR
ncbi:hypothetical protein [Flavobacterium sp.]|uniref:hypothetical protein n=1 Tax=Flavobacterium sp. TaxID=239 RepID=UPI003267E95E